jgi:uncharacterized cupin superfamily protein
VNLYSDEWEGEMSRPGRSWRHKRAGGERIGAGLYELPPGGRTFPYHYHYGIEEWLLVVVGRPTVRTPDGTRELVAGDVVRFPVGAAGAHSIENASAEPARVLIASNLVTPSVSVYPDSDKVATRTAEERDRLNFPRSAAVDYWHGEET